MVYEKLKFTDDGTVWISEDNPQELAPCMTKDLQSISKWTYNWRMKLNGGKTEYVLFTRDTNHVVPSVELQGKVLKCAEEVRPLGIILDKRLTFQSHTETEKKRKTSKLLGL